MEVYVVVEGDVILGVFTREDVAKEVVSMIGDDDVWYEKHEIDSPVYVYDCGEFRVGVRHDEGEEWIVRIGPGKKYVCRKIYEWRGNEDELD